MKKILIVAIVIFVCSCSDKQEQFTNIELNSNLKELYAKKHFVSTEMLRPSKIYLYNDKLVVFDDQQKDIFKIFGREELNFLYSFGSIGLGPDEFVMVDKESVNVSDYFEIMDKNKLFYFQLTDYGAIQAKRNDLIITKYYPIHNLKKITTDLYIFDNNNHQNYTHEFRTFDLISKKEDAFSKTPDWSRDLMNEPSYKKSTVYSKSICYNNDKIAVFYYHYPVFKIYSKNLELLSQGLVEYPYSSLDKIDTKRMFFTESYATDKYIYVMWIDNSKRNVERNIHNFKPELLVFDWNGFLVDNYLLDQPIITFAVSHDNTKLYAVSFKEEDLNVLYEYDLPEIKVQTKNEFHNIKNKYYSLDMLNGYFFSNEKEKNLVCNLHGNTVNSNYFGQRKGKINKDLESININLYFNESLSLDLEKDMWRLLNLDSSKVELDKFFVNDRIVFHTKYIIESDDYDGNKHILHFNTFMFYVDNSIVDISICSKTADVDGYQDSFKRIIESFILL